MKSIASSTNGQSNKPLLLGIHYSPWTEKARWALDFYLVPYRYREHIILLSLPELALRSGRCLNLPTVPYLVTAGRGLGIEDSLAIAKWAHTHAQSGPASAAGLFPDELMAEIEACNALSERILNSARPLYSQAVLGSWSARQENLPSWIPSPLRPALAPMADLGVAYIRWTFGAGGKSLEDHRNVVVQGLEEIRKRVQNKKEGVLGPFTYADITLAVALQFVKPVPNRFIPMGEQTRVQVNKLGLAEQFSDLVQWRDQVYESRPISK